MQQNLKTASGQEIHYSDPNYKTYLAQGAKPVEQAPAPATPAQPVTPAPKAPVNQISTNDLITPDRTALDSASKMGTFVTYDPLKGTAGNRRAVEVGQHGQNDFLETPINGADYSLNPNSYVVTHKNANTLFGFKKPVTPTAPATNTPSGTQVKTDDKVTADNWLDKSTSNLLSQYEDGQGKVGALSERVRESQALMDAWETTYAAENLSDTTGALDFREDVKDVKDEYTGKANEIKDRVMAKQFKNAKINGLLERTNRTLADMGSDREGVEIEQARRQATDAYNYTMDSIQHRMLTGQYTDAINLMNSASQQLLQNETMRINRLEAESTIKTREAQELRAEAEAEDKRRADGWMLIKPENVEALMLKHGEDRIYTNPVSGKTYLLPDEAKMVTDTIEVNGQLWGVNNKGEKVVNYGSTGGFSFSTDDDGNVIVTNSATGEVTTQYKQPIPITPTVGSKGGQCGDYLHSVMDGTKQFGDLFEQKKSIINAPKDGYTPLVGDILIFETLMPYGHVAAVKSVNGDQITVTESNYNKDEIVGERTFSAADLNKMKFAGAYRGAKFKDVEGVDKPISDEANAYAKDILSGKITIANVPDKMKNETMLAKEKLETTQKSTADQLILEGLNDKIDGLNNLINHRGMAGSVGPYGLARWTPFTIDKADRVEFIASVEQIIQQETIDKLINSKAAGATYGALSDGEREMLAKSASKIGTWRITDKTGKVIGYEVSEDAMNRELETIRDLAQRAKDRIAGDSVILPPGQIADDDAYNAYLNTINQ